MSFAIAAAVFPVIFVGELPDKTMFASLVLSSRGRPWAVWLGAAGAFLVHVAIAVTIGAGLFALLPQRALDVLVAVLFAGGAVYAFLAGGDPRSELVAQEARTHRRVAAMAFAVVFVAEWGDLTQILTANLAAHYRSPFSVAVGAVAALWTVAALAVVAGQGLLRYVPIKLVRWVTGTVLLVLAGIAAYAAVA
jgi:putative Ca2+/H+ antiporter (TMEM165/GDT1 family)